LGLTSVGQMNKFRAVWMAGKLTAICISS